MCWTEETTSTHKRGKPKHDKGEPNDRQKDKQYTQRSTYIMAPPVDQVGNIPREELAVIHPFEILGAGVGHIMLWDRIS